VIGNALLFKWQIDSTGKGFVNLKNDTTYKGVSGPLLTVLKVEEKHLTYKFRCVVSSSCPVDTVISDTVEIAKAIVQSEPDNQINIFQAWPNPASDAITIMAFDQLPENITVLDLTGRPVYICKPVASIIRVDIHDWPAGVYLIKASTSQGTQVVKVIKE
jgi:hypothetical protein